MKVAYVFSTSWHTASYKLGRMILPQLEEGRHGVEVIGMFFFDDNTYLLRRGDPTGERVGQVARDHGMLLMLCDQCASERGLAGCLIVCPYANWGTDQHSPFAAS